MVGDDLPTSQSLDDGAGPRGAEGEEAAAPPLVRHHKRRNAPIHRYALRQEPALDPAHMRQHRRHGPALARQPILHRIEAIERRDVEGGAEEAAAVAGIADAGGSGFQRGKSRIPAGIARTRTVTRRRVQEAGAFSRHGVFIAAGEIEGAVGDGSQIGRHCQEAVMAVDDDEARGIVHRAHQRFEIAHGIAGIEEHLAHEDEVPAASAGFVREAVLECLERRGRHARDGRGAVFFESRHLACEAHELRIRGQHPQRPVARQTGEEAQHEGMGVGPERHRRRIGQGELPRDMLCAAGMICANTCSHLRSSSRAASFHAAICASCETSGQGRWLCAATCSGASCAPTLRANPLTAARPAPP